MGKRLICLNWNISDNSKNIVGQLGASEIVFRMYTVGFTL
jgi:hypothetical protein